MSNEKGGMGRPCAACKHQKKKCHLDCPLLPYFPADKPRRFENVLNLFGVNNILRVLKQVKDMEKSEAMESIIYEAYARERDPVHGCYGIVVRLQKDIERLQGELGFLRRQIRQLLPQQYHNSNSMQHSQPVEDCRPLSSKLQLALPASTEASINPNQGLQLYRPTENDVNKPNNYVESEHSQQPYCEPKEAHESSVKKNRFVGTIMDRNVHCSKPTKRGVKRLRQNDIQNDDIDSTDDELINFAPSTHTMNTRELSSFHHILERENKAIFAHTLFEIQSKVQEKTPTVPSAQKRRTLWSVLDTIVLIEAKANEIEKLSNGGPVKKSTSSMKKWKTVQEYCSRHGVFRTADQCRDRWEHVLQDYKKIRDYESHIPFGHESYWDMTDKERVENRLPQNFPNELMDALEINFGTDRTIDLRNTTIHNFDYLSPDRKSSSHENASVDEID